MSTIDVHHLGRHLVEVDDDTVRVDQGSVPLSPMEQRLLAYFFRHPNLGIDRETLYREVWGYNENARSRTLDTTVRRLRAKIEPDPTKPRFLVTSPGVGYRLALRKASTATTTEAWLSEWGCRGLWVVEVPPESMLSDLLEAVEELHHAGRDADAADLCITVLRTCFMLAPQRLDEATQLALTLLEHELSPRQQVLLHTHIAHGARQVEAAPHLAWAARVAEGAKHPGLNALLLMSDGAQTLQDREEAVRLSDQTEDTALQVAARLKQGFPLHAEDPDTAYMVYRQAIRLSSRAGYEALSAAAEENLAVLLIHLGQHAAAVEMLWNTATLWRERGNEPNLATTLVNIGWAHRLRLEFEPARSALNEAALICEQTGDAKTAAAVVVNLCGVDLALTRTTDLPTLQRSLSFLQAFPGSGEAHALCTLGFYWFYAGRIQLAAQIVEDAVDVALSLQLEHLAAEFQGLRAMCHAALGEFEEAERKMVAALAAVSDPSQIATRARFELRRLEWRLPGPEERSFLEHAASVLPAVVGSDWEGLAAWKKA